MSVKIRLQRQGRRNRPFYHIVVADSRSPRDGRIIEQIGTYDVSTNPATIVLDNNKALNWLQNGAQLSDTTKSILSRNGILYQFHLQKGVTKGVLTKEKADEKLQSWTEANEQQVRTCREEILKSEKKSTEERFQIESKQRESKAQIVQAKRIAKSIELEKKAKQAAEEVQAQSEPVATATTEEPILSREAFMEPAQPATQTAAENPQTELLQETVSQAKDEKAENAAEPKAESSSDESK